MRKTVVVLVGAGVLVGVSVAGAAPRNGIAAGAKSAGATAPLEVSHHWRSRSSSGSSGSARFSSGPSSAYVPSWRQSPSQAPAARSWGSPGRRWNAPGSSGSAPSASQNLPPRVVTPYAGATPRYSGGPRWVRPHGRFGRRHVSIRLLAPIIIAGSTYYAYRYAPYDGPVCSGITENGCELRWMEVPLEDSDETELSCVEFCPQQ